MASKRDGGGCWRGRRGGGTLIRQQGRAVMKVLREKWTEGVLMLFSDFLYVTYSSLCCSYACSQCHGLDAVYYDSSPWHSIVTS